MSKIKPGIADNDRTVKDVLQAVHDGEMTVDSAEMTLKLLFDKKVAERSLKNIIEASSYPIGIGSAIPPGGGCLY